MDNCVRRNVLLAVCLPECTELRMHVAPLIVCVLMARWHLLDRVDVNVDVCSWVRGVEHLAERQDEAACGVLGKVMRACQLQGNTMTGCYYSFM